MNKYLRDLFAPRDLFVTINQLPVSHRTGRQQKYQLWQKPPGTIEALLSTARNRVSDLVEFTIDDMYDVFVQPRTAYTRLKDHHNEPLIVTVKYERKHRLSLMPTLEALQKRGGYQTPFSADDLSCRIGYAELCFGKAGVPDWLRDLESEQQKKEYQLPRTRVHMTPEQAVAYRDFVANLSNAISSKAPDTMFAAMLSDEAGYWDWDLGEGSWAGEFHSVRRTILSAGLCERMADLVIADENLTTQTIPHEVIGLISDNLPFWLQAGGLLVERSDGS